MIKFGNVEPYKMVPKREAAYGILFNAEEKIAVVYTPRGYFLPGGGIEPNESHEACLIREFQEELGYVIEVKDYLSSGTLIGYAPGKSKCLEMVGHNYFVNDTGGRTVVQEIDHTLVWMPLQEARIKLRLTHQAWTIEKLLKNRKPETLCYYNSHWKIWFDALEGVYKKALGDDLLAVEHFGSTAIEGMRAKPIIDIDLVMESYASFDKIKQGLEDLGYEHCGDLGIYEREAFKRNPLKMKPTHNSKLLGSVTVDDIELLDEIPHHLYVCPGESLERFRHIHFRDTLKAIPELVIEYNRIKDSIIQSVGLYDYVNYVGLKMTEYQEFFRCSGIVDLHMHTTASDGTSTPEALMAEIVLKRLALFSVTDHDSVANIDEIAVLAKANAVDFIPGVEISVLYEGKELHILTYGVRTEDETLQDILRHNQTVRDAHNKAIVAFACARHARENWVDGDRTDIERVCDYDYECVNGYERYIHDTTRGGWKALNFLMDNGIVASLKDFFKLMDEFNTPLVFKSYDEVIPKLKALGYLTVLAHPPAYYSGKSLPIEMLDALVEAGVQGIECYSPYYASHEDAVYYLDYCKENGLAITCGSDYHGEFISSRKVAFPTKTTLDVSYARLKEFIQR